MDIWNHATNQYYPDGWLLSGCVDDMISDAHDFACTSTRDGNLITYNYKHIMMIGDGKRLKTHNTMVVDVKTGKVDNQYHPLVRYVEPISRQHRY